MKRSMKTPQWVVAKRARKKAKRTGKKVARCHGTPRISNSR